MEFRLEKTVEAAPRQTCSYLLILILTVVTLAVFWPLGNYDFINTDDDRYLIKNPELSDGLSWKGLAWAFSADLLYDSPHVDYWQPVTLLSRMLDVEFFGLDGGGHHRMNLIFHILNVILLFIFLSQMTGCLTKSALIAGLFALHPLQVQAVAWITARKDLLAAFFGLLTMLTYRNWLLAPSRARYLQVVFLFLMGLMSKPVLIALPFALLCLDYGVAGRLQWNLQKGFLFILSAVFLILPFIGQPDALSSVPARPLLLNVPVHYVEYIKKVFYPVRLTFGDLLPEMNFQLRPVIGAVSVLLGISTFVIYQMKRRPYLLVGWFWFLGLLVPTMGAPWVQDRFMYLPIVGLFFLGVLGISELLAKWHLPKLAPMFFIVLLFLVMARQTFAQVHYWKDSITLFEHTLEINPNHYVAYNQICAEWLDRGDFKKAVAYCSKALQLKPGLIKSHYNLGLAFAKQGRLEEAITHYQEAVRLKPDYPEAHNNLGVALGRLGRQDEAVTHFLKVIHLQPDFAEGHNNLGAAFVVQEKLDEAMTHYNEALRLKPNYPDAHHNIAVLLEIKGEQEAAIAHYRQALRLNPNMAQVHQSLGLTLARQGKRKEAARHFLAAENLNGGN